MIDTEKKAQLLVEALPYIQRFAGKIIVIKFGGSIMVDPELRLAFAKDVALLRYVGIYPIIVHGGGKEISKWMKKVGKEAVFIDGLRFTDSETMELTEMVLSGKISNQLVDQINQMGGQALALSGKSANLFTAEKIRSKKDKDLGFVGQIESIDDALLHHLVTQGYIPVISSIGRNEEGETLNLNADNVAFSMAAHLSAEKLIYLTDVDGLMIGGELQNRLPLEKATELMEHPEVSGGMLPKLECSLRAIQGGVNRVHIINGSRAHATLLELFTDQGIGTLIYND